MECILIQDLRIPVYIGIYASEQGRTQTVSLDLEIGLRDNQMFQSDDIDDTIDYADVVLAVTAMGIERHYNLVEHFADWVAALITGRFRAPWVRIRVGKVDVIPNARFVGVSIERFPANRQEAERHLKPMPAAMDS
ncbi:dihydroneopterin aldolase [Lacisediminimonas sp.]|uniref:dihydroneopterin aldolase n=1 Tax=Lacisediminimonas sp. TaxID=3060582 RepID=UPI002721E0DD|nr:dihydroneopterin aldolase [Lacisediminimonas sp.]MDO8298747.1 dihydroneopterin aldolase [Lacisediminimonas sp.]MDO9216797.1 dihydroneopterin aldolase [Lacisediminimonas sp.]